MPDATISTPSPTAKGHCWLPNSERSPRMARKVLRDLLESVAGGERYADIGELLISELVTNAVLHGTETGKLIKLVLEVTPGQLLIAVEDASDAPPKLCIASDGVRGRGLLLVAKLSKDWGWGPREGIGKRVWCICTPGPVPLPR
ncbi:ATP-binding protein [Kitasatospora viridis]|uniref:Anti-sigma regulatory factor (Ser/Thr protein kinase) n=1 Tax=Kitasatospora viridis TaxID=281105 RepID=A0A561UP79_9ACTN|nr:ATP-binding protein [Kitasatospora viridis]TWG01150.1 anti-sigma regulatory factor (Ser/Thr protein kinase) [Kitasatospora viridis]